MATPVVFTVYHISTGLPLAGQLGAGMAIATYKTLAGTNMVQPTIVDIGGGDYEFTPSDSDVSTGVAFEINTGTNGNPARFGGSVGDIVAWPLYALADGSPLTGISPAFTKFSDFTGVDSVPHPTIVEIGGGLYGFQPTGTDLLNGRAWIVNNGGTAIPDRLSGSFLQTTSGLHGTSAVWSAGILTLSLTVPAVLSGLSLVPSNWLVTAPGKPDLTVSSVTTFGSAILLGTSEPVTATYSIAIPDGVVSAGDGTPYLTPNPLTFSHTGAGPSLIIGSDIDARALTVFFSEPVQQAGATVASNYSMSGGITVLTATKLTDTSYRLTTREAMRVGVTYTVTCSNIRDLAGNLIA